MSRFLEPVCLEPANFLNPPIFHMEQPGDYRNITLAMADVIGLRKQIVTFGQGQITHFQHELRRTAQVVSLEWTLSLI